MYVHVCIYNIHHVRKDSLPGIITQVTVIGMGDILILY